MSRSRARATLGTVVFLVLVPGTVAGLTPWWLTHWDAGGPPPLRPLWGVVGAVLVAAGTAVLLEAFARFVVDGIGTPAPVAPTEKLVVSGLYRHVRNPMYLAVGAVIAGQASLLGRAVLVGYLAAYAVAVASFVRGYEEPTLRHRFGGDYDTYCQAVPAWRPRLTAWSPGTTAHHSPIQVVVRAIDGDRLGQTRGASSIPSSTFQVSPLDKHDGNWRATPSTHIPHIHEATAVLLS